MNLSDFLIERPDECLNALQTTAQKFLGHPKYEPFIEVLDERKTDPDRSSSTIRWDSDTHVTPAYAGPDSSTEKTA